MKIWPSRRTVKRWGIGASILVGILLLANAFMAWRVESRFRAKVAAIRAAGDPASIAELQPKPIPADENAAAHLDALQPRLEEFAKEYRAFFQTELGKAYDEREEGVPPTDEQLAAMKTILDKYADLEQMIVIATSCPHYASTADFTLGFQKFLEALLERVTRIRTVARMVDWKVQTLIAEGRQEDAARLGLDMFRLARLHEAEPTLVAFLVSIAVRSMAIEDIHRALAAGPVSVELHNEIEHELATDDDPSKIGSMFRTERAVNISGSYKQGWEMMPAPMTWFVGWPVKQHFIGPLDYYEVLLPIVDRPWSEIRKAFESGGALAVPTGYGVMADLLGPALQAAILAAQKDVARVRSLRAFNALQAFAEKNGREASGLAEVGLSPTATVDPFSGQPLMAKLSEQGWRVYSVGENGTDDEGDFHDLRDVGVGPASGTPK